MVLGTNNAYTGNTYNAHGSLKLLLEAHDVKTAYIKPHCMTDLVVCFTLLMLCTSFAIGPSAMLIYQVSNLINPNT